jgi:thioredoxin 1
MAGNLVELTDATFDENVTNSEIPVLVDFWAPWCGPCKMLAPMIAELADEYAGKARVCKMDTDEHREAAIEYGINAIPTLILFKGGNIEKKWVGLTSKDNIAEAIDALI